MPELPEVETIKTALAKGIGRAKILNMEVRNPRLRVMIDADIVAKTVGATIVRHRRIAKYIQIELDNGWSLLWHMGMSGKITIADERPKVLAKHDHVVMETSAGVVIYNDARRFGMLAVCKTDELYQTPFLKKTGIDPFDEKFDANYLFEKLEKRKKTPIKIALLDQEIVAGIGNIYASEILYESRILPSRLAKDVSKKECMVLVENIRKVLEKAIKAGGSTLKDYKKPDGSLGYFQNMHCVYNKTGQKCPCCTCDAEKTGGIKKSVMGGRSTFYCESLQK